MLTIGHGNVYAANKTPGVAVRALRDLDADSVGINEGNRAIGHLRALARTHRLTLAPGTGRDRETPIIVKATRPPLGDMAVRISDPADPLKWAPARWLTAAMYRHPVGSVAHVNVHLNAVVTDVPLSVPRVREYAASTEALAGTVRYLEQLGYLCVVSGDVNMTARGARGVVWSAHEVLEAMGYRVESRGVDVIAYPRKALVLVDLDTIAKQHTGSDHPFLRATLKARP